MLFRSRAHRAAGKREKIFLLDQRKFHGPDAGFRSACAAAASHGRVFSGNDRDWIRPVSDPRGVDRPSFPKKFDMKQLRDRSPAILISAFFAPVILLILVLMNLHVTPFGDGTFLRVDMNAASTLSTLEF